MFPSAFMLRMDMVIVTVEFGQSFMGSILLQQIFRRQKANRFVRGDGRNLQRSNPVRKQGHSPLQSGWWIGLIGTSSRAYSRINVSRSICASSE